MGITDFDGSLLVTITSAELARLREQRDRLRTALEAIANHDSSAGLPGGYTVQQREAYDAGVGDCADIAIAALDECGRAESVGLKDFRAVFIFNNRQAAARFISRGWQWGGEAEAGFKSGPKGKEVGAVTASGDLTVYQFTKAGVQLRAMVPLTKYWQYYDLN